LYVFSEAKPFPPFYHAFFSVFLFSLFVFFASRPPLGGIDDGVGGFAQDPPVRVLRGNDGEQRLYDLEKLWPLGARAYAARNVADSSSNSVLWVERHTAGQRVARLDNAAMPSS
jgi:hypothetical protein